MITVFGSINMDLIATTSRLPKPGETIAGDSFSTAAGGKGANQALAARRAGCAVRMAGAVGTDDFAKPALALLSEAGVDLESVQHTSQPTGTALIFVGGGDNMIAVIAGANATLTADDAQRTVEAMNPSDLLMLQLEIPAVAIEAALRSARSKGIRTILNLAPLVPDAVRLAGLADIVIANETEFELLAGKSLHSHEERREAMQSYHAQTGQTLIVTLGADGVLAIHEQNMTHTHGLVIDPVDTVGAGDTFCGYLAASLDEGLDFEMALRRSAVAGSLACLSAGAQPSIPLRELVAQKL